MYVFSSLCITKNMQPPKITRLTFLDEFDQEVGM